MDECRLEASPRRAVLARPLVRLVVAGSACAAVAGAALYLLLPALRIAYRQGGGVAVRSGRLPTRVAWLPAPMTNVQVAAFSQHSRVILLRGGRRAPFGLAALSTASGRLQILDASPGNCHSPCLSPDGQQIAYHRREPDQSVLLVVRIEGGPAELVDSAQGRTLVTPIGWISRDQLAYFRVADRRPLQPEIWLATVARPRSSLSRLPDPPPPGNLFALDGALVADTPMEPSKQRHLFRLSLATQRWESIGHLTLPCPAGYVVQVLPHRTFLWVSDALAPQATVWGPSRQFGLAKPGASSRPRILGTGFHLRADPTGNYVGYIAYYGEDPRRYQLVVVDSGGRRWPISPVLATCPYFSWSLDAAP